VIKHITHIGESLNLNWRSSLEINTRIVIGRSALKKLPDLLSQIDAGDKILLVKPANVLVEETDRVIEALHDKSISVCLLEIQDGETCKSTDWLAKIWETLHDLEFSRQDTIVAIGGGAVTDIAGFAASTYLRGISLITIPTTLLAQVDAAIGGKTAINFQGGKNLIGNYYFAKIIIVDTDTLATLPSNQFISGLAEVIKYSFLEKTISSETDYLIGPKPLLSVLEDSIKNLSWDNDLLPGIIIACIKMKLAVVGKDPQELGLRRCLNLGHTLGHALESVTNFKLSHGEAVAIGMAFALHMAVARGQIGEADKHRALTLIEAVGLPTKMQEGISASMLVDILFRDKKREGEAIKMILPKNDLGLVEYKELIKREEIEQVLAQFCETHNLATN